MDAYTERWLGEVSTQWALPPMALAVAGFTSLAFVIAILLFASYTRQTTVQGVINGLYEAGSHAEVTLTVSRTPCIHPGENLPLEIEEGGPAAGRSYARITSIASAAAGGGSLYRIGLEIPLTLRTRSGVHFQARVPLERHRLYQWMFSRSPN